ncbi:MAG: PadR family transcriptional regulator [Ilumatobacteraceae bacterium]
MQRHGHGGGPGRHRARRGAIRASILQLLAERPMHGYELIQELDQRTGGRWRPSPGSVYPTLAHLDDEGLVTSTDDDGRKRFELTEAGKTWLDEHQGDATEMPWEHDGRGGRGDLRRLAAEIFGQLRHLGRFGSTAQLDQAREILTRTRTDLYAVLAVPPSDDDAALSDDDTQA